MPCTPLQQETISHYQGIRDVSIDVMFSSTPLTNMDRITYTWQALASHHPILRTCIYAAPDGCHRHIVHNKAATIKSAGLEQPDTSRGAYLTVFSADDGFLVSLHVHHALVDTTSLVLLQTDFILFYSGYSFETNQSFVTYVNHVSSQSRDLAIEYWTKTLLDGTLFTPLYLFPLLYESPRRAVSVDIPDELFGATLRLTAKFDVPLASLLYGAWALGSAQHMHGDHESVGFVVTGRDLSFSGHETVVGLVDQDYPLVLPVPRDTEILSWIRCITAANLKASAHAFIGYRRIMETASVQQPQVKVCINLQQEHHNRDVANSKFPLLLDISALEELRFTMWHNSSVPETHARVLLKHFWTALQYVVENPLSTLRNASVICPAEKTDILNYGKPAAEPVEGLLHTLVEQQATLTPNANAIQYEMEAPITYAAFNMRANRLARQLAPCRGLYIPVCMHRSTELVVALLAILKAGAAYVTLDPDAPLARNLYIIEDVKAPFVIVDENTAGSFRDEREMKRLVDDAKHNNGIDIITGQDPSEIAYVIYTSGSTGSPKGVLLEHKAAFNGLLAQPKAVDLRRLLFHNPVFSAAQRSVWATLVQGGCLCLASRENLQVNLTKTLNMMEINALDMTSTTASLFELEQLPSLRRLTLGGELVSSALVHTLAHRVELLSSYGLSECTQLNWRQRLRTDRSARLIGQPSDTTTSYILAPGTVDLSALLVPGELCLGGSQLAREYLNDPDRTRNNFIPNPFGSGRLYRTGDLAIRHPNGSIELIGRIDYQVKINGQRVDPNEPNMIIQTQPDVEKAATVPALIGKKMALIAVIVARQGSDWAELVAILQRFLLAQLPSYMIPSFWVSKSDLPLNRNGKVDMPALQSIVEAMARSGQLLPTSKRHGVEVDDRNLTATERILRRIWSQSLSLSESKIGLEDSFLDLGGTSLEAIQVVSQFQRENLTSLRVEDVILGRSLSAVASLAHNQPASKTLHVERSPPPFSLFRDVPSLEHFDIKDSDVEDAYPVTPFQEAVIAETLMGNTNYIYTRAYSFRGHELGNIKNALATLTRSEPLLRSTFVPQGTSFLQVIRKDASSAWETSDMELQDYLRHQKVQPMVAGGSYLKVAFLPADVLVVIIHHALFDYWSSDFLSHDISSILIGKLPIRRPPFNLFIDSLQSQDKDVPYKFWSNYLKGAVTTKLQPNLGRQNIVTADLDIDLKACSSKLKVTPSILIYAAWAIVLAEACSQDDIVFGITLSGRDAPIPNILQMSGPTLTIALLRLKVDRTASLETYLQAVQSNFWDVTRHAHYGLRNILQAGGRSKDLFDTAANFLIKLPVAAPPGGLETLQAINRDPSDATKLEINNNNLNRVTLTTTVAADSAQCLANHVVAILHAMSKMPHKAIGELDNGFHTNKQACHSTMLSATCDSHLGHSFFDEIAASNPRKVALQDASGVSVTYAELAQRINQFANMLRFAGVGPEIIVPVMLQKSINTVITLYGIMAAGGAFTTLDPENPRERNLSIIEDVEATLAITDLAHEPFFKGLDFDVIVVEHVDWDKLPTERIASFRLQPDNAVYVVYTSGSTGKPKGVIITHRALSAVIGGMIEGSLVDGSSKVLWALNYVFDGSFHALFWTLSVGGTLCLAPQEVVVANMVDLINRLGVTHLSATPTLASLIHPDEVPDLSALIVGGEPLTPSISELWGRRASVLSGYGPSETTILVTSKLISGEVNLRNVGRCLKNVTAFVLDPENLEPVPFGEVGELCIAGPQVARGYLKRPQATAAVFHTRLDGSRLYQTGDLARWLPDGEIELFGRKDDQIKINGYRIELGEVESAVLQTGLFSKCVVVAATVLMKKQLVAFYLVNNHVEQVRERGNLLLPPAETLDSVATEAKLTTVTHYMKPAVWLPLAEIPLMISGKADRKLLVALAEGMDDDLMRQYLHKEEGHEIIESEAERVLQSLWSSLFGVPAESVYANSTFHAFGGDSISAINLVSMCRRGGYEMTVKEVLSNPTLKAQAAQLRVPILSQPLLNSQTPDMKVAQETSFQALETAYGRLSQLNISQDDVEDVYPCSPGQIEFLTQGSKQDQFWQLMTVRSLPEDFDFDRWLHLTAKLTEHNPILRTLYLCINERDPLTAIQVVLKHSILNVVYLSYDDEQGKQQLLDKEWDKLFEPDKTFVRYSLLTSSQDGSRDLVIKLDHASYDGSLLRIFDDQFIALNNGLSIPNHTPFKDFIRYVTTSDKQGQLNYWTNLLRDSTFSFPTQLSNPKLDKGERGKVVSKIGINESAQAFGVTVPIVFQTAYTLLLSHLSGASNDVLYDNLITGRNVAIDNPQLINGNCANFLPFRSHLPPTKKIKDLLLETQSLFWETTENGMVGIGEIYAALNEDRRTRAAKNLFCFQPFEPGLGGQEDPMRWVVMKLSTVKMNFNYAVMLEVSKDGPSSYKFHLQYDSNALSEEEAKRAAVLYVRLLERIVASPDLELQHLDLS